MVTTIVSSSFSSPVSGLTQDNPAYFPAGPSSSFLMDAFDEFIAFAASFPISACCFALKSGLKVATLFSERLIFLLFPSSVVYM